MSVGMEPDEVDITCPETVMAGLDALASGQGPSASSGGTVPDS